jgi:hypothetical protein
MSAGHGSKGGAQQCEATSHSRTLMLQQSIGGKMTLTIGQHCFTGVKSERIERAITDDLASRSPNL